MSSIKAFLSLIFNLLPFIMAGVGWYMIPALKFPVTSSPPFEMLGYSGITMILWLGIQVWISTSRNTSVSVLQADSFQGIVFAMIMTGISCYMIGKSYMPWALAIPWFMTVADAVLSSVLSINNASQKPLVGGAASN